MDQRSFTHEIEIGDLLIYRLVVGPIANNVYIVRSKNTGESVLIDAANEHEKLLEVAQDLGVKMVLETHGHLDHIGAVSEVRDAGYEVYVAREDANLLPSYDQLLNHDEVIEVGGLRIKQIWTPGHTPGSYSFAVEGYPVLFTGDTLFPGGPGTTALEGGDFSAIINGCGSRRGISCGQRDCPMRKASLVHSVPFSVEMEPPVLVEVSVAA